MTTQLEEPLDNALDTFFGQFLNPFSEQENTLLHMWNIYPQNGLPPNPQPTINTTNRTTVVPSPISSPDKDKVLKKGLRKSHDEVKEEQGSPPSTGEEDLSVNKQKARRHNQNLASRNYRNRKKEYLVSLESRVAQLTSENDLLKKEIASLKRVDNFDSMRPDPALLSMVVEMKHIVANIDDAIKRNLDDNQISYLLQLFHLIVEKRHHVFEKEVEKLVNPFAQAKLAMLGYIPDAENLTVTSLSGPSADGWWNQYIQEAKVSREQRHKLKQMREELWKVDEDLRKERKALDKSIKEFYLHKMRVIPNYPVFRPDQPANGGSTPSNSLAPPGEGTNVDVSDIIELSRKLNSLKKNFCTTRNLMLNAFARLSQLLTPRQQAMLLVRIHIHTRFDTGNMELLKNVWQSVTNSESPSVLSLLSMLPNGQPPPPGYPGVLSPNMPPSPGLLPPIGDLPPMPMSMPMPMQMPAVLAPHTLAALTSSSTNGTTPTTTTTTTAATTTSLQNPPHMGYVSATPSQQHAFRGAV